MRKTLLARAITGALVSPLIVTLAQADVYDARSLARGGTGMTMGEYNQALYNPALLNRFDENDDFSFAVNVAAIASDKDGFIDAADDIESLLDELESNPPPAGPARDQAIDDSEAALLNISGKLAQVEAGGALMVAIPNNTLPVAFVAKAKAGIGTSFTYDPTDRTILEDIANGISDQNDLTSRANASALGVAEFGLMMGKGFELAGLQVDGGATLKVQNIELIAYQESIGNFDVSDVVDSTNLKKHRGMNVDLGLATRLGEDGKVTVAGTIENLVPQSYSGPGGTEYDMAPVLTAAAGYNGNLFKVEANVDLSQRNGYDLMLSTQFARVGVELSAGRHFHLRAGYRADLKSNVSDLLTAGIGITPWDRFNIDIGGGVGEGETYAVGVQIGFKI